ncbi:MAG: M15 family metallopeptidase [Prevotella sp.]|nr:M15 family metallopeptidase [Prevotella sp.]
MRGTNVNTCTVMAGKLRGLPSLPVPVLGLLFMSLWPAKAAAQTAAPPTELDTLYVQHVDFEGMTQEGVIVCNKRISGDLRDIFAELYRRKYPIERIRPISEYANDDERSMQANNTSCYCYRPIAGSKKLSKHALGLAVDINPLYNPCVRRQKDGTLLIQPSTGRPYVDRSKAFKYKITKQDLCYRLFTQYGFRWGGNWKSLKDYQHFEK